MISVGFGISVERLDCEDGTALVIRNDWAKMESLI